MLKVAIFFDRFGPYHFARLHGAADKLDVIGLELSGESEKYAWDKVGATPGLCHITLFPGKKYQEVPSEEIIRAFEAFLAEHSPDVMAIPGWAYKGALCAMQACRSRQVPMLVMSESTVSDFNRSRVKELLKRRLVSLFSSALVGGQRHVDYMVDLNMDRSSVFTGYNAVDNQHFRLKSKEVRDSAEVNREALRLPDQYFLASSRFTKKKNIPFLLKAYAEYKRKCGSHYWKLVLLGDGPMRDEIEKVRAALDLTDDVIMPGFKQYDELPVYFALAGAFVLASRSEQWGLVVNESLASGTPVIVSNRCGCAPELVREGENGFTFDPDDEGLLIRLFDEVSSPQFDRERSRNVGEELVSIYSPQAFGEGMEKAVNAAISNGVKSSNLFDSILLKLLSR